MMPEDLKEFLRAFNEHGVKYLIVGGYAFGAHAESLLPRMNLTAMQSIEHWLPMAPRLTV